VTASLGDASVVGRGRTPSRGRRAAGWSRCPPRGTRRPVGAWREAGRCGAPRDVRWWRPRPSVAPLFRLLRQGLLRRSAVRPMVETVLGRPEGRWAPSDTAWFTTAYFTTRGSSVGGNGTRGWYPSGVLMTARVHCDDGYRPGRPCSRDPRRVDLCWTCSAVESEPSIARGQQPPPERSPRRPSPDSLRSYPRSIVVVLTIVLRDVFCWCDGVGGDRRGSHHVLRSRCGPRSPRGGCSLPGCGAEFGAAVGGVEAPWFRRCDSLYIPASRGPEASCPGWGPATGLRRFIEGVPCDLARSLDADVPAVAAAFGRGGGER